MTSMPSGAPRTVLLDEDNEDNRIIYATALRYAGYNVLEAATPAAALEICRCHPGAIHLLLSDVVMPGMNGGEMARQVEKLRPETRVLFMSGYTDNAVLQSGELRDGVAFLQKPFTPSNLGKKVREILDAKPKQPVSSSDSYL